MLYSGTSPDTTSGYLNTGTSKFNSSFNSPKYVGYMYGENEDTLANARTNTNNSTIKTAIDNWYASNITSYTKYLSTAAVYCNDRTEQTAGTYNTGNTTFYYAPNARAYTSYTPTYDCTEASDAFSVDNISITGSTNWWLLFPSDWLSSFAYSFFVRGSSYPGNLDWGRLDNANGVRPANFSRV